MTSKPTKHSRQDPRAVADRSHGQGDHRRVEQKLTWVAMLVLTAAAAAIRARGFSHLGLFRDDAWVALSARTGLGTAWHMWVTTPGYSFVERLFILIGPHATWWDQIPSFAAGVLGVPAMYAVVRYFRIGRIGAVVGAALVCVSPICVIYSTRVKSYSLEFLLTCVVLVVAEHARRTGGRRQLTTCAVISVAAFAISASTGVVIVGVWLVLGLAGIWDRPRPNVALSLGAATAVGCALVAAIFYSHISPALNRFWSEYSGFIQHTSPSHFVTSLFHTSWTLLSGLFGFSAFPVGFEVLIIVVWLALSLVGLYRDPALAIPGLAVLLAVIGSVAHVVPLGTGRTDEYLYPVILVLPLAGAARLVQALPASAAARFSTRQALGGAVAVSCVLALVLIGRQAEVTPSYPGVAVMQLAAAIHRAERPGDHIYVNESMRYPWALYESDPLHVQLGVDWSTNFTVVSTDPDVFIDPSEDYEGDQHPQQWATDMSRYQRIWYVWSPVLSVFTFSYGALLGDGWHIEKTINAPGCAAYLLVRGH